MMTRELVSRIVLVCLLGLVALFLGTAWTAQSGVRTVQARMPEQGGWEPGDLSVQVGQPLHLRLVSEDVTHGFAVGQTAFPPVDLYPGEAQEVTLTFDKPGKYTYYCTRWCGQGHWRMRGTIEVTGNGLTEPEPVPDQPLYARLGIDIDSSHPAQFVPSSKPDAGTIPDPLNLLALEYQTPEYYQAHSPDETWRALRADPAHQDLDDQDLWSLVAALWQSNTTPEQLASGQELYALNCAACHGENGDGNGVFANITAPEAASLAMQMDGQELAAPADFTDPNTMLGASPALLHGKILRGGMGTGMPYWGPIFTDQQVWALVSYLWTFQFNYTLEVNP